MPSDHEIIIRRRRPWLRPLLAGGALLLLAGGAALGWRALHAPAAGADAAPLLALGGSDRRLAALSAENQALRERLAYAEHSADIDQQACALVKKSIGDLQTEASNLREQLAFYRGILAPQAASAGLRVYDFAVRPAGDGSGYQYDLLLINAFHHDHKIGGSAAVSIEGLQGGQPRAYPLADLAQEDSRNLLFSFTYFQELDGRFSLPEGFRPLRVKVTLHPEGGKMPEVEETYDWVKIEQQKEAAG